MGRLSKTACTVVLLLGWLVSPACRAQYPVEEIGPVPVAPPEGRPFLPLVQPTAIQSAAQEPCPCRRPSAQEVSIRRVRFLREQAAKLRADKKHKVHVYLLNHTDLRGQILSDNDTYLTLRPARGRKEVTISYTDVSWMQKEPTGGEKFRRGVGATVVLTVTSPLWVPWFALMWALYPRE